MKVLFLDIDGVLNSQAWYTQRQKLSQGMIRPPDDFHPNEDPHRRRQLWEIDDKALLTLKKIVEDYDFKIVISSAWRIGEDLDTFAYVFGRRGWKVRHGTIIGKTPSIRGNNIIRGDEIDHWLGTDGVTLKVERYLIIDDSSDFHPHQKPHFVQTDNRVGLQPWHHEIVGIHLERGL